MVLRVGVANCLAEVGHISCRRSIYRIKGCNKLVADSSALTGTNGTNRNQKPTHRPALYVH